MYRYLLAIAIACFVQSASAQVQVPDTVFLEKMTWEEVGSALAAGKTTVIVPTGGTEQNGPHMALGKHQAIVGHAAGAIARAKARRNGRT